MPPIVLTTFQLLFLALLYLFIARAVRIIYLDMVGPKVPRSSVQQQAKRRTWGSAHSIAISEPDSSPRVVQLKGDLVFGKSGCDIELRDTFVSVRHARIYKTDQGWLVEDLGSTNGTYVNKARVVAPTPLKPGDQIKFGKTMVEVRR